MLAWHAMLKQISSTNKPVIFATGAASIQEVTDAVSIISEYSKNFILMQCNTNYTGSDENFKHINLNVLKTYQTLFPDVILGLSDHTHGGVTALGSVALGARAS